MSDDSSIALGRGLLDVNDCGEKAVSMPRTVCRAAKELFCVASISWVFVSHGALAQSLPSVPQIVSQVRPSVVQIITPHVAYDSFSRPLSSVGMGSGVIFDRRGLILTNNHIIEDAKEVQIFLPDGRKFVGKVLGTDRITDLAVVMAIGADDLPSAPLGDSSTLKVGETVVALGNALGLDSGPTVTAGVVSAINRSLKGSGKIDLSDLIQTDAAIHPGNSGGPLVNGEGEVIGINITLTPSVHGVGFAMAINKVKPIAMEIVEKGKVVRPWLGILPISIGRVLAAVYNLGVEAGVLIADVEKGSPGEVAGLKAGDIIVAVAGDKIKNFPEFLSALSKKEMGDTVQIEIRRNKKPLIVSLMLKQLPSDGSQDL